MSTNDPFYTVLITDAGRGSAIALIRSLGRIGHRIIAADDCAESPGLASKFVAQRIIYPNPSGHGREVVAVLAEAARRHQVDLLIPVTDQVIVPLEVHRQQFPHGCRLALPPAQSSRLARDKSHTFRLAEQLGVPCPKTELVQSTDRATGAGACLGWPVVIKPVSSLATAHNGALVNRTVCYARDRGELDDHLARLLPDGPVMLQEFFAGRGVGLEVLAKEGRVLRAFQHERLREVPLTGGTSSMRRSVPVSPSLLHHARQLIEALEWTGLAMVEFKVAPSGEARLMEINGRIWGSFPLAVHAGVDFPERLCRLFMQPRAEMPASVVNGYCSMVYGRNIQKELSWIVKMLTTSRRQAVLPLPRRREVLLALRDLLRPSIRDDILSITDPKPGFRLLRNLLRSAFHGVLGGEKR